MPTGARRGSIGHVQDITEGMRAILVDWLVEVQESFELNHETLYTAVKLMDLYLSKVRFLVNLKSFKVAQLYTKLVNCLEHICIGIPAKLHVVSTMLPDPFQTSYHKIV